MVFGRFAMTETVRHRRPASCSTWTRKRSRSCEVSSGQADEDWANPVRCAEAIYRFTVRRGMSAAKAPEPEPELPFDPVRDPLDALAAEWAALDREPGPEEIARARDFVGVSRC